MSIQLQIDILEAFISYPEEYMSLNAIAKRIDRAYPQVHSEAKQMISHNLLSSMVIGKSIACTPNMKNPLSVLLMGLSQARKAEDFFSSYPMMRDYIRKILISIGNEKSSILYSEKSIIILTDLDHRELIEDHASKLKEADSNTSILIDNIYCQPYAYSIKYKKNNSHFVLLHGFESFFSYWGEKTE